MAEEIEYVRVPKVLLDEVLDNAESDSYSTQAEFSCSAADDEKYSREREKIEQLRQIASITGGDVVGQGFFGAAIALCQNKTLRRNSGVFQSFAATAARI